jgi:hypothetical protein
MRYLGLLAVFAPFVFALPNVHAAGREAKERAARKACLNGDATKGVDILTDLYILTNDATYVFNQGRCYEQARRYEDAVGRFREYLVMAKNATSDDRADAEKHIANCLSYLGKPETPQAVGVESGNQATAQPAPPPVAIVTAPVNTVPNAVVQATSERADNPQASSGRGLVVAGVITGSVGMVAIAGGILSAIRANNLDVQARTGTYDPSKEQSSKTYKTAEWIFLGVGAAALGTGAVLAIVGATARHEGTAVSVAPLVGPGAGGASIEGRF